MFDDAENEGKLLELRLLRQLIADAVDPRHLGRVVAGAVLGGRLVAACRLFSKRSGLAMPGMDAGAGGGAWRGPELQWSRSAAGPGWRR